MNVTRRVMARVARPAGGVTSAGAAASSSPPVHEFPVPRSMNNGCLDTNFFHNLEHIRSMRKKKKNARLGGVRVEGQEGRCARW